ncbi:hypothetical protein OAO51_02360 [Nitrosomonadaceae bacterium]|nr:hypothetical protein [Nitrosomonadaceae bacterium]
MQSVAHFHYHASTLLHLCNRGHEVIGLFDEPWSKGTISSAVLRFKADHSGFTYSWLKRRSGKGRRNLFELREIINYARYLHIREQSDFYLERWLRYTPAWFQKLVSFRIRRRVIHAMLGNRYIYRFLRGVEKYMPPDKAIMRCIADYRPDVIVASPCNIRYSEEIEYIKAGKAMGLPTVIPVLSWDNLTTKGLYHIVPDMVLAWNAAHRDEASRYHNVPETKIVVSGSSVFDFWKEIQVPTLDYQEFCATTGLDSSQPLVLYLGSSTYISGDELWLVRKFVAAMRSSGDPLLHNANIMVRPHPSNAKWCRNLSERNVVVWPRNGDLPDTREGKLDFYNALHHAFVTVGVNTTGMIDAVINDKPGIAIMSDGYKRTQEKTLHFRHLLESGAIYLCGSEESATAQILQIYHGQDTKCEARKKFVSTYIRPRGADMPAGLAAAMAIEALAGKTRVSSIDTYLRKSPADLTT